MQNLKLVVEVFCLLELGHFADTQPTDTLFIQLDDDEESDDEYSGKDFDRESPRDDVDINMTTAGFDIESMANARKVFLSLFFHQIQKERDTINKPYLYNT